MLYNRTYIDKCATIIKGSKLNTGFNPVSDLVYGRNTSRTLIHFDHTRIKNMVEDKTFPNINKLKHYLKITNAGSLDMSELHKVYGSQIDGARKKRASSFDLIFFLIPKDWDNGKGFDYTRDYFNINFYDDKVYDITQYISEDGANWFQPSNGYSWKDSINYQTTVDEQLSFYIKSDKNKIDSNGGTVTFIYKCGCNDGEQNKNLEFKIINNSLDFPVKIGTPIHYSASGKICHNDAEILKYGKYVMVTAEFPENNVDREKKYAFRLEYKIGEKIYKSNPYTIVQYPPMKRIYPVGDDGIYSTKTLEEQLQLFENGENSIIIGKQHFDIGCENISIDITKTFNQFITGELDNHGIGIAFAPNFEYSRVDVENYIGLLTNRTNSFFEPYVETIYEDSISDDRSNFVLGRKNRLYFYSNIGGDLVNLDYMPSCCVNGVEYEVYQASKGIYYIEITLEENAYTSPTMLYDVWSNIVYKEERFADVELEFTTQPSQSFFKFSQQIQEKSPIIPTCYGIDNNEHIRQGDIRKLCFLFYKEYAKNTGVLVDDIEVSLHVMDGTAEVVVMPYIKTNRAFTDVYTIIDTSILIPNTYYVDARMKYGMEMIEHHNIISFTIVNEENNKYT